MKSIFCLGHYNDEYVMHCDTKEKAILFCRYLNRHGYEWATESKYSDTHTNWETYKEKTVYHFKSGFFGNIEKTSEKYTVLEFDDFNFNDKAPFQIEEYKGDYAMRCKTEKEAEMFCEYLRNHHCKWNDGESYSEDTTYWNEYKKDTIYYFNDGVYGSVGGMSQNSILLNFDEFNWGENKSFSITNLEKVKFQNMFLDILKNR